jgi:hypothetical protein
MVWTHYSDIFKGTLSLMDTNYRQLAATFFGRQVMVVLFEVATDNENVWRERTQSESVMRQRMTTYWWCTQFGLNQWRNLFIHFHVG